MPLLPGGFHPIISHLRFCKNLIMDLPASVLSSCSLFPRRILLKFKPHQALLPSKPSSGFPKANIITRPTQSGLCCHSDLTYYSLLLPHWLLGCFSNMSVIILPQDLCICYSLRHPTA